MNQLKVPALLIAGVIGVMAGLPVWAQAEKNSDPTPRRFMGPDSASKVYLYEAKRRRNFGVDPGTLVQQSTNATSAGRTKACNTTIGPSPAAGQSSNGSGYSGNGQNNSTVIITGDVINVCK